MIIYGYRSTHLNSGQLPNADCPSCGTKGSVVTSVFGRYAHIFWIPLFPIGKTGVAQCQHCKYTMEDKKAMSEEIQAGYQLVKAASKAPKWHFAGLVIIAGLIAFGAYSSGQNDKNNLMYLNDPQVNDVYSMKLDDKEYSTSKIMEIKGDSVYLSQNEYVSNRRRKLYKIDKAENYGNLMYTLHKDEIKSLFEEGTIFDIDRD